MVYEHFLDSWIENQKAVSILAIGPGDLALLE